MKNIRTKHPALKTEKELLYERIDKAEELLKDKVDAVKSAINNIGGYVNRIDIGERYDDVKEQPSIGLTSISVFMEWYGRTYIVFRNFPSSIEMLLLEPINVYEIEQAEQALKDIKRAEVALRRLFLELYEPLIPESIWSITA